MMQEQIDLLVTGGTVVTQIGFWGPDVLAVHCVKMQPEDIEIFVRHNVKVSHNPVSNMYLGVGIAPIREMRRAGLTVALGTDGAASNNCQDMIQTLKTASLLRSSLPGRCCWMKGALPRWMKRAVLAECQEAAGQLARRVGTDRQVSGR